MKFLLLLCFFPTTGGIGREATTFYWRLVDLLSHKNNVSYNTTLPWMRCTLPFSLLQSATVCISGSWFISYRSPNVSPEVGLSQGPLGYTVLNSYPALNIFMLGVAVARAFHLARDKKTINYGSIYERILFSSTYAIDPYMPRPKSWLATVVEVLKHLS